MKEEAEITEKKIKTEVQVTISPEHDSKLRQVVERVASGFDLAKISRKNVLEYMIDKVVDVFSDDDTQAIRRNSTTDMALLEQELRDIRQTGIIPEALKEYLWKSRNLTQSPKKPRKSRQAEYSNAIYEDTEAA
ncbi:MAG: hypothetical protein J0L82_18960 [Deltaproteobacteria bacterium]|jgi:hypothetical protein|nr:hypothetical protein [Deltaproteobacteria bacterium]